MPLEFSISPQDSAKLSQMVEHELKHVLWAAQKAGAQEVQNIALANLGPPPGKMRPAEWPQLSEKYAKKVGRDYATLEVTGKLRSAIKLDTARQDQCSVYVDEGVCEYALVHQYGSAGGKVRRSVKGRFITNAFSGAGYPIPARPYMPIHPNGELTEDAKRAAIAACGRELSRQLAKR